MSTWGDDCPVDAQLRLGPCGERDLRVPLVEHDPDDLVELRHAFRYTRTSRS
jgi:hypothetical protein